ncbi:MAG: radical SAM protein [Phycisphaerales bacterium]|nr:radical SAM protein [Phycisphaerales bacterium]
MDHPYRPPTTHAALSGLDTGLLSAVAAGQARLTPAQALEVFHRMPTAELGRWADARCRQVHGEVLRTYVIDRNINYTNVCTARCTFCAFRRDAVDHDAYTLETEELLAKIGELVAIGGTQILMQGGMNPGLPLDWYLELLAAIKSRYPRVHVHAFSPPELIEFVGFFGAPGATLFEKARWVLGKLKAAGMDSLPGGGGEIFAGPVRRKIGLGKCDQEAWLTTMYAAHSLGMFTSASMMFGHIEGYADRIHHMGCVRGWQDKALGWSEAGRHEGTEARRDEGEGVPFGHYKAFISWPFQRDNTPLGRVKDWGSQAGDTGEFPGDVVANLTGDGDAKSHAEFGRRLRTSGTVDYLRTQAVSRLFLDNVYSIGASWVTMGPHVGQTALAFGANDMGSVMMEENVVSAAGTTYCLDEPVLCRLIREAGFLPAQRNNTYDILRVHEGSESPDLAVRDWSEHRLKRLHVERRESAAPLTIGASDR